MTRLPAIPPADLAELFEDLDELRDACLDDEQLEPCHGGCGELVAPNGIGIAWCGDIDCARQDAAWDAADRRGARV